MIKTDESAIDLIKRVLEVYTAQAVSEETDLSKDILNKLKKAKSDDEFERFISVAAARKLEEMLPVYDESREHTFDFIDLFAGIGGIRKGFEDIGGRCMLTSEWNEFSMKTYRANYADHPDHKFVPDIKAVTQPEGLNEAQTQAYIRKHVPDHHVLLAGFPCQPFSIAGVSKKNALGRSHGFECEDQGQLFFDIIRLLKAKKTPIFVLENVKNLKSHDKGNTFKVIREELKKAGYWIANVDDDKPDPKIIDGANFLPQHRERIVLVGFHLDYAQKIGAVENFDLRKIESFFPAERSTMVDILDKNKEVDPKYTLTPKLWEYLVNYAAKHKAAGNGFGYGMVKRRKSDVARTLSARYYKDGSEVLVDQQDMGRNKERDGRPRRLTPQECARLMGFTEKGSEDFKIPVSDTQAYKQFGNSVVVPVFRAVAEMLEPFIQQIRELEESEAKVSE